MKLISGIYGIEDVKTGNLYVGRADSDNGIKKRWSCHKAHLKNGEHNYKELQEPFNKNKNNIKWIVLEECSDEMLEERENFWLDYADKIDGWHVINKEKKSKKKSKVRDKTRMRKAQQGENNGHNTKLSKEDVFEILDLLRDGVSRTVIAAKYDIYPAYTYRLGKDRWVKAYQEWLKEKEITSTVIDMTSNASVNA